MGSKIMRFRFSILKKFVFTFLLLSMLPLCGFGFFTTHSLWKIVHEAIESSSAVLEKRATEAIELRAIELAKLVS